jgi:hypothetical protein
MKLTHWRNAIFVSACLLFTIASGDRYYAVESVVTNRETTQTPRSSVPPGYVRTPAGLYHESCVHEVPEGSRVHAAARKVTLRDGTVLQYQKCGYPVIRGKMRNGAPQEFTPSYNGWLAYTTGAAAAPIGSMSAEFSVPNWPQLNDEQTIFLFPGIVNSSRILQPVLAFRDHPWWQGGGQEWTIESWSCDDGDDCYRSSGLSVDAGWPITGQVNYLGENEGVASYEIVTSSYSGSTSLSWEDSDPYWYAVGGALETYDVEYCAELPSSAPETFSEVAFWDRDGNRLWLGLQNLAGGSPDCQYAASHSSDTTWIQYDAFWPPPQPGCLGGGEACTQSEDCCSNICRRDGTCEYYTYDRARPIRLLKQ